jgi:peptidoglycan/LPS O-acetylase OafA/YrhL
MHSYFLDHNKKINKIQGIRGIAIIAILLYHLGQDKLERGYLGVDV